MITFLYKILYAFCWLLALLPLWVLYRISDCLFLVVYCIARYRKKIILENLRNAFPEKSEKEIRRIRRQFYQFLCDLFLETLKVIHASSKQMNRRIRYSNPAMLDELYKKNKQIFYVTGHYGNFEWLATLEHTVPYHMATLYQPLQNKFFDKLYYDLRTKFGTEAFPSNTAIRAINKLHDEKRLSTFCFLADQAPDNNPTNYWTTFLNQETAVFTGVEKLAKRYNPAVLYYEVRRVKRGYYEVDTTLITENAAETTLHEITDKHVTLLEETIKRNPQYWLWSHRRWKRKRGEQ